jgi:hypothetical protein
LKADWLSARGGCSLADPIVNAAILEATFHVGVGSQGQEVGMEDLGLTRVDDGCVTNDPKLTHVSESFGTASIPQGPMSSSPARRLMSIERR